MLNETTVNIQVNDTTFGFLQQTQERTNILYGGAGSGKSWSIAQFLLLEKMLQEQDIRILMVRATRPAIKKSSWLLINDLIKKYEIPGMKTNLSDLVISGYGNTMFFVPLDDPEKLKSFERINYVWCEEATEIGYDDYMQLNLRCRGENTNGINQLFYSFNPIDEQSFWKPIVENPPDNTAVHHSTYEDNAFNSQEYIDELLRLIEVDSTYHKIYTLGLWASPENIIYTNYDILDDLHDDDWFDEVIYGVDFGFNNPSAVVEIGIKDKELYERELLYEKELTNADLITALEMLIVEKDRPMYADSAEPARIKEISRAGFNVHGADKGKNSVKDGIDFVKRHKCHISKESVNLIKEKGGYKYREDKDGNVLEEPVKFNDHLLDAERYAVYTHMSAPEQEFWVIE